MEPYGDTMISEDLVLTTRQEFSEYDATLGGVAIYSSLVKAQ